MKVHFFDDNSTKVELEGDAKRIKKGSFQRTIIRIYRAIGASRLRARMDARKRRTASA